MFKSMLVMQLMSKSLVLILQFIQLLGNAVTIYVLGTPQAT